MQKDKNNLIPGDEIDDENSEYTDLSFINPDKMLENIEERRAKVRAFLATKPEKISLTEY